MKELVERDGESHPHRARPRARIGAAHLANLYQDLNDPDAMRKVYEQAKIQLEYLLDHDLTQVGPPVGTGEGVSPTGSRLRETQEVPGRGHGRGRSRQALSRIVGPFAQRQPCPEEGLSSVLG